MDHPASQPASRAARRLAGRPETGAEPEAAALVDKIEFNWMSLIHWRSTGASKRPKRFQQAAEETINKQQVAGTDCLSLFLVGSVGQEKHHNVEQTQKLL